MKLELKFDLKLFGGETNAAKLNQWLEQLEVFFKLQKVESDKENIDIATLKLEVHALVLWEAYSDVVKNYE